jgi:hypothetical protein
MKIEDEIIVELRTKIDGVFVIGSDALNEAVIASEEQLANDLEYEWSDITEGILSIDIKRGVDTYTGAYPLPIPSVGIMHVRTTNKNLDPNINIWMEPKGKVRLRRGNEVIFQGRINNQFVDYRSDKDKPLITFDVMDPIMDLQQTSTKLTSLSANSSETWSQRIQTLFTNAEKQDTVKWPRQVIGGGKTKHSYWDDSRTLWEALTLASNTEGGFIYYDKSGTLKLYASETIPTTATLMEFNNEDDTKYGYKNIAIDYNVASTINEVVANNTWGYTKYEYDPDLIGNDYGSFVTTTVTETKPIDPQRDQALINRYGNHALNAETNFDFSDGKDQAISWAQRILNKWKKPKTLVKEIEWDAKKDLTKAAAVDLLSQVKVHHKTPTFTFEDYLTVIGIQHSISAQDNTWKVKFILFPRSRFI